jgi:hypothetical protein
LRVVKTLFKGKLIMSKFCLKNVGNHNFNNQKKGDSSMTSPISKKEGKNKSKDRRNGRVIIKRGTNMKTIGSNLGSLEYREKLLNQLKQRGVRWTPNKSKNNFPETLYHFTNTGCLLSILKNGLWKGDVPITLTHGLNGISLTKNPTRPSHTCWGNDIRLTIKLNQDNLVKGRVNSYQCGGVKVYHSG